MTIVTFSMVALVKVFQCTVRAAETHRIQRLFLLCMCLSEWSSGVSSDRLSLDKDCKGNADFAQLLHVSISIHQRF